MGIIEKVVNVSNLSIPYLENDTIKKRAEDILKKYVPDVFQIIQPTPLDDICSKLGKKNLFNLYMIKIWDIIMDMKF